MSDSAIVCDFSEQSATEQWEPITDRVMGGLSDSSIGIDERNAVFSGVVSLENKGGFASIRTTNDLPDLTAFRGLRISVRGDGNSYQLRASSKSDEAGHAYKHDFAPTAGEWLEVELPFAEFVMSAHGRLIDDAPALDPRKIHQLSFLIAGGHSGEFALHIRRVEAY
jgi:hypothetical protein